MTTHTIPRSLMPGSLVLLTPLDYELNPARFDEEILGIFLGRSDHGWRGSKISILTREGHAEHFTSQCSLQLIETRL